MGGVGLIALVFVLAGLCLLCMAPPGLPLRYCGVFLCLPLLFPHDIRLLPSEVEVTVLDVGQGLAVIARTARHVLVYDTGDRRSDRFDAGRDIVAPSLRNLRVDKINMLVVSHRIAITPLAERAFCKMFLQPSYGLAPLNSCLGPNPFCLVDQECIGVGMVSPSRCYGLIIRTGD